MCQASTGLTPAAPVLHQPFPAVHVRVKEHSLPMLLLVQERFDEAGADFLPLERVAGQGAAGADRPPAQPEPQNASSRAAEDSDLHGGSLFQESSGHQVTSFRSQLQLPTCAFARRHGHMPHTAGY